MKKMSALILLVIILFQSGCSAVNTNIPTVNKTPEKAGFAELNVKKEYVDSAYSLC